jgi:FkbM family methyltransferase
VLNFDVAVEYEKQNQTASAVSFYLRTAEYGLELHPSLVYTSLLKVAHCFDDQNDRQGTVSNCLLQAVGYLPYRPEAYFLLAQFHERLGQWQECYTWAQLGLHQQQYSPLPADVGYEGQYVLKFEKAVSAWWIGRKDESIELLEMLSNMKDISPAYKYSVLHNLDRLGLSKKTFIDPLEPVVMNYRKFFGEIGSLIIDIGSREGNDAVYLSERLYASKVIAIDANPKAVEIAKQLNPSIEVHYSAITDFDGEVTFHQVVSDNIEIAGCSSIASKERSMFPGDFEDIVSKITVPATHQPWQRVG